MSTIDERVVEMRFDNAQFEKNVATSLSTLDKLKAALKLDGSSKGLEELQKSTNSFNMNPLVNAVNQVNDRFSALNVIGTTALVNITNKAINAGEAMVKSLSVDNISAGWNKFGEKTQSVATLVSQGYDLSTVEEQLEKLNWYTDETSYNFTDMVSNIGKFTASGQELEPSVRAMMGIANAAALAGQNATTASRAMYQISQAMGKGVMKYDDWKSIQNASMDTVELRQQIVKAASELGVLKQVGDDAYQIIGEKKAEKYSLADLFTSDALSRKQWFTSPVMMKAFSQYSAAVDDIYNYSKETGVIASEAMEILGDNVDAFGLKAFKAAQQCRTFQDVVDATKDAVSTGWMNSFEYIFGNFEEATELWSNLAEVFYDVFASGGEARNEMLKLWKEWGGRDILLKAIATEFENITKALEPLSDVLKEFIPEDIETRAKILKQATINLLYFANNLKVSEKSSNDLADAFRGVLNFIGLIVDGFRTLYYILSPLLVPLNLLAGYFVELLGAIGNAITGFRQFTQTSDDIASKVENARTAVAQFAYSLSKVIIFVAEFIKHGLKFINLNKALRTFNHLIKNMATRIAPYFNKVTKVIDSVTSKFTKLFSLADIKSGISTALINIADKFNQLGDIAGRAINKILPYLTTAKTKVLEFFSSFSNGTSKFQNIDVIGKVGNIISNVGSKLGIVKDTIVKFITDIKDSSSPLEALQKIFENLRKRIEEFGKVIETFSKDHGLDTLKDKFITSFNAIIDKIKELGASRILLFIFGVAITSMMLEIANAASKAAGLFSTLSLIPNAIQTAIKQVTRLSATNSILQVAEAIGLLALSLKLVSTINSEKLGECAAALLLLAGAMAVIAVVMNKFGSDSGFAANAVGIVALTGSVLLLAVSLALLEKIEFKHLLQSLEILGIFALGLVAVSRLMSFASGANVLNVAMLLAFAFSMEKVTNAFVKLTNEIKPDVADKALETLKMMMIGLGAIAFAAKGVGIGSAVGLIGIILSLDLLYKAMRKIAESDINMSFVMENLDKFKAVFAFLAAIFLTARLAGKSGLGAGVMIIAIGAAMQLLVGVLERIDALGYRMASSHWKATLTTFMTMMAFLGLVLFSASIGGKGALRAAVAIVAISACMFAMIKIIEQLDSLTTAMTKAGSWERTMGTLIAIMASFAVLMGISALTGKAKVSAIMMIMASIGILIAGMAVLSDPSLDQNRMLTVAEGISLMLLGLGVCFGLAGKLSSMANTGTMVAVTAALVVLIGGLIIIMDMSKSLDPGVAQEAAMAIGIVLMSFAASMYILASAASLASAALPGAQAILTVALAMIPMAAALMILAFTFNSVSTEAITASIVAATIIMFTMAGAATVAQGAIMGAAAMAVMSASLLIAAGSLALLTMLDPTRLEGALKSIAILIGVMTLFAGASVLTGGTFDVALKAVAISFAIFAGALIGVSAAALIFAFAVDTIIKAILQLSNISSEETERIGQNIVTIMASIGTGLGEGLKNLAKSLWEGIKNLLSNIGKSFTDSKASIKISAAGALSGVLEAIREMLVAALGAVGEGILSILGNIASKAQDFFNASKESFGQFTAGVRESIANAINAAKELIDKVVGAIKEKAKDFKDAAVNCVQGFINGFGGMVGDAIEAVKGFAGNVLSVFNVTLGNASPSKKFAESGYYCVAGYKRGIEKNTGLAEKAMRNLAKDGVEAFNDYMGIHSDSRLMMNKEAPNVLGGLGTGIKKYSYVYEGAMTDLGKDGTNAFADSATSGLGKLGEMIPSELKDAVDGKLTDFSLTGNLLQYANGDGFFDLSGAKTRTEEQLAEIEASLNKGADDAANADGKAGKAANDYGKASGAAAKSVGKLGSASSGAGSAVAETAKKIDMLTDIMDYASNAVGIFNTHWAMSQDNLSNTMSFQASKDAMELLAFELYEVSIASETAEESAERMAKSQIEIAADIKKAYLDMRSGIVDTLKGQIDLFKMADYGEKKKGGDLLEMARSQDELATTWENSFQTLGERVAGLNGAESLMRHFADEGMTSMGDLSSVLDMTAEELKEFAGYADKYYGSTEKYGEMADRMMASLGYVSYKAAGGFVEGLNPATAEEAFENFTAAGLQRMYDKFGMSIQSGRSETMATIAQELADSFAEGLDTSEVSNATEQTGVTMVEALNSVANEESGKECAINVCKGIAIGFDDGSGPVYESAYAVGELAKKGVNDGAECASPSKATTRTGRFMGQGLINGLKEYGTRVKDAASTMAIAATDGFSDVFTRIAETVDGAMDLNPTISPVLDLSNLQYGASQIGALLGLGDPYALNATASITGIQNDASMIASMTDSLKSAISGLKTDNEQQSITIHIHTQPGQSAEEIADYVAWKLNHDLNKRRAAYGGA